jgi:hypothetical protein
MTVSILTTFYDKVFKNNKCPIQTERSDQWTFERLVGLMMATVQPKHVASAVYFSNN